MDHKPLIGILNDTELEKISNRRLQKLKEKTFGWRFNVIHVPGSRIGGTDGLSRNAIAGVPDGKVNAMLMDDNEAEIDEDQNGVISGMFHLLRMKASPEVENWEDMFDQEEAVLANIRIDVKAITWEDIQKEVTNDTEYRDLRDWIIAGCPGGFQTLDEHKRLYWTIREKLRVHDGVPMLGDRTVIPRKFQQEVLKTLHAAHQGTSSMIRRATDTVYWPGFVADIERTRARCNTCNKIAPSQANLPPVDPIRPEYPMQHICMDYFQLNNKSYGIIVDRFSNWPIIYTGDSADDVCMVLTCLARDYGIPETVSTDGAQCYVADKVAKFMRTYGIKHRVSSVANPHSNCRAGLGFKTLKRMIRDNVTMLGKADTPEFSRALLQYRNTKDRDTGLSPAEFMLGRQLRDFLPASKKKILGHRWIDLAKQREAALAD